MTLSWKAIPYLFTHGILKKFVVRARGRLKNGTLHNIGPIEVTDIRNESLDAVYVMNITNLFPETRYNYTISGCTTPGCGPVARVSNSTVELGEFHNVKIQKYQCWSCHLVCITIPVKVKRN